MKSLHHYAILGYYSQKKTPFKFNKKVDYRKLCLPASNALAYVCGYLIEKCFDKHSCDTCLNFAKSQDNLEKSFLFVHFKAHQNSNNSYYGNLNVPPDKFFNYVNPLDDIFVNDFPTSLVENNVGSKLKNLIDNVPFNHPRPNFNVEFLKTLCLRFRIFYSTKYLNTN